MLSVYTYSAEESQNIYTSISQPDGDDIVFSEDGHVACNFKKAKTKAEYFYPNPVVAPPSVSTRPDDISNTVGKFMRYYSPSFYFSDKFLFSVAIFYKLASALPMSTSTLVASSDFENSDLIRFR